jgi:hypothetical protein
VDGCAPFLSPSFSWTSFFDEVTDAAVDNLRVAFGGTLSLEALLPSEEHFIADANNKVWF